MSIDIEALRALGNRHRVMHGRGHILYHQGEPSGPLYVLLRGSIEFRVRDPITRTDLPVESARAGELFGEVSCFDGVPRAETAVVQEDGTILLVVDAESALGLLAASRRFGAAMIRRLCARIRAETEHSLQLSHQVADARAANQALLEQQAELQAAIAQLKGEAGPDQAGHPTRVRRVDLGALAEGIAEAARSAHMRQKAELVERG